MQLEICLIIPLLFLPILLYKYVEYNNLADSYGNITHKIFLSDSIDNDMNLLNPSILLFIIILLMI